MMPSEDATATLKDDVARASEAVQRAERLHDAVFDQRNIVESEEEKRAGIAAWLKTNDDVKTARQHLMEAKRRLARAQGDTFHDDATPTI